MSETIAPPADRRLRLVARRFRNDPDDETRYRAAHPNVGVEFVDSENEIAARLHDADAAMGLFRGAPDSPLFDAIRQAPRLRWLHVGSAGVDLVPMDAVPPHIVLTCGKGPMAVPLAEHAVGFMLALARHLPEAVRDQQARRWPKGGGIAATAYVRELAGRTVLILGVGAAGSALARICKLGFGMRVVGFARTRRQDPHVDSFVDRAGLAAALAVADFVCVTLALTAETRRLVDAAALATMKPTAFLVNVARGEVVDEAALVAALQEGRIAGAGLDTFEVEPLSPDSPLWGLPNVLITPHRASGSDRVWAHYADFFAENIRRFGDGEPVLGVVDRAAGY